MAHFLQPRFSSLLLLLLAAVCLSGCMTRRTRLMEERSELLRQRDQLQDPWQAHPVQAAGEEKGDKKGDSKTEEPLTSAERIKQLNERVSELDAKLLQLKPSSPLSVRK